MLVSPNWVLASRPILSLLPRFLFPFPISVFDLVRNIVESEKEKKYSESKIYLLSLINCLYEAEDSSLCVFVADLLNHDLDLDHTTMNPIDCLSVGYFASVCSNTSNEFTLRLGNCSIGDQGSKFLARGLSKCPNSHSKISLYLCNNDIHDEGIHHIAEVIENTSLISLLSLSTNLIGNSGLSTLCEALSTNTSLKRLYLNDCSLTISDDNGAALYQLLNKNNSLENLNLSYNTVTSCRHIAAGLAVNKTLRTLDLICCKLTDQSIEELSTGLINKIEALYIYGNYAITEDGMKTLARHLTTHCSELTHLSIPNLLISCINTCTGTLTKRGREMDYMRFLCFDLFLLYKI